MKEIGEKDPRYESFLLGFITFFSFEPWTKLDLFNVYDQGRFNGLFFSVWEVFPAVINEDEDDDYRASEIFLVELARMCFVQNYDEIYTENTGSAIYREGFEETYNGEDSLKIIEEIKRHFESRQVKKK
jgi:hypothetical protein